MAKQAFLDFCNKIAEDDNLGKKVQAAQSPSEIVALGAQYGYVFSENDAQQSSRELAEESECELSEHELSMVSGGRDPRGIGVIRAGLLIYKLGRKLRWW